MPKPPSDSMDDPAATKTEDFQAMLRAAESGLYDILLVGYPSRFLRDVQLTLHYRRFFHRNGVVILICDDRILSSDPDDWERLVDKVKADEVYSRNLGRNIRTGLEEKRRAKGDPGGQPPLVYLRENKLLAVDPATMPTVERAFALSAAGQPDHAVADSLGLTLDTVRHVLTNPIYIGRLTDGNPFRLGAAIGMETWNLVLARRELRRTRLPGVRRRRCFPLKLFCADCGLALQGDEDRYRHASPVCEPFREAQPETSPVRGRHALNAGTSYPRQWYEAVVEALLDRVAVTDERAIQRVVADLSRGRAESIDQVTLMRIARARSEALRRLEETRDVDTWKVTVARLDAEEVATRTPATETRVLTEPDIRAYLANLGNLWRSSDDESRQGIALALFDRLAARGFREVAYDWSPTAKAYGLDQLAPDELELDLPALGLSGAPRGTLALRRISQGRAAELEVLAG